MSEELPGVARGAETVLDALDRMRHEGFRGNFTPLEADSVSEGARLQCGSCHRVFGTHEAQVTELRRLEGASDPDDMLAVVALECPRCATRGTLVLNYGPTASTEEAAALVALAEPQRDPG
jgi:hypothetical protein